MKKIFKNTHLIVPLLLPAFLTACNTMEGAGTDIKEAGKALKRSAERNKEKGHCCPVCGRPHSR